MTVLMTLIAMNTLLFLGLSVSKFAPWPNPVHPDMLRQHDELTTTRQIQGDKTSGGQLSHAQRALLALTIPFRLPARSRKRFLS